MSNTQIGMYWSYKVFLITTRLFEKGKFMVKKTAVLVSFRDTRFLKNKNLRNSFQVELKTELSKVDNDIVLAQDDSTAFDVFNKAFSSVVNDHAPLTQSTNKYKNQPNWFNNKLKNLWTKRNKAHADWMKDRSNFRAKEKFKDARMRFEKNFRLTKAMFYRNTFKSFERDKRQIYNMLNELTGKRNESKKNTNTRSYQAEKLYLCIKMGLHLTQNTTTNMITKCKEPK